MWEATSLPVWRSTFATTPTSGRRSSRRTVLRVVIFVRLSDRAINMPSLRLHMEPLRAPSLLSAPPSFAKPDSTLRSTLGTHSATLFSLSSIGSFCRRRCNEGVLTQRGEVKEFRRRRDPTGWSLASRVGTQDVDQEQLKDILRARRVSDRK